jgi:dTDP-4-dehydrorhamnose reductase
MGEPAASRFLVLGAGGLVGRHIRAALAGRNAFYTYRRDAPPGDIQLDITDAAATQRIVSDVASTVVVLAAADAYVERCEREPESTWKVNVDAAAIVAEAARAIGALLVIFSSEYVFDGTAGEYREEDQRRPINEYGRQKVALEDIALDTGRGLVCRTSGVFGNDPNRRNFVCQLVDRLRTGQTFEVPSDQLVTPTYAPSLAEAVVQLADRALTGVFHVAGPDVMGRVEFARAAASAHGLDPELLRPRLTSELHLAARRPARCGLRTDKLRVTLGRPLVSVREALRELATA